MGSARGSSSLLLFTSIGNGVSRYDNVSFTLSLEGHTFLAEIAQLVEHNLAKVGVASSSLVFRSKKWFIIIKGFCGSCL